MVVFAIFFALGVWLLQQQAALPGFAWVWLLLLPFTFFPFLLRSKKLLARSMHILPPQAGVPQRIYLSTYSDDKTAPLEMKAGERWRLTLRLKQPHGSSNPH